MLRSRTISYAIAAAATILLVGPAAAQLPSNATVKGSYNVRYLGSNAANSPNDVAVGFSGTITFDGSGNFTVSGQGVSGTGKSALKFLTTGQYSVLSNGIFQMTNPFDVQGVTTFAQTGTVLYGGVGANGVLIASSTDTYYVDLFVGVPAATSGSNSTLSGTYYIGHLEFLNGDFTQNRDTFFKVTADGKGGLGNVTINGTASSLSDQPTSQTSNGATYTLSGNGTGTMIFPAPSGVAAGSVLLSGNKVLYATNDGNFFIAGGTSSYDMIVGVKALSGNPGPAQTGLFFTGLLQNIPGTAAGDGLYGIQGSSNILAPNTGCPPGETTCQIEIGHQRTQYEGYTPTGFDFTFDDDVTPNADGTSITSGSSYVIGAGNYILGTGVGANYFLNLYVKAPTLVGTGVFLNPQGVVNAANSVPFTAGISPGEVISLYGNNLAQSTTSAGLPFPTTLGGASVNISYINSSGATVNLAAPIYSVSPGLINAVVPYSAPSDGTFLNISVTNSGTTSNVATFYSSLTQPGIFTYPTPGGVGNGAIEHANFSVVTPANPAKPGETVIIYLTGLGAVTPAVGAGTSAPANPLSQAQVPSVYIDDIQATVLFAGLTPGSGGLYQLNVTIPSNVTRGQSDTIEIVTADGDNNQATIPISQ
jgi:uncharacterized protein (TIGR03437 family)